MQIERGVVFGVSNLPWLQETLLSAATLKRNMPELPIELHIDKRTAELLPDTINLESFFDFVCQFDSFANWRDPKFSALRSKRFSKVLYLDGDTYILDRLDELFDLLDNFDIAAMPAPQRIHSNSIACGLYDIFPTVPASFPEYNAGVMPFLSGQQFDEFVDYWQELYEQGFQQKKYRMDQAALRVALFHSKLRLCALTPEYNLRAGVPNVVKDKVKIIHAHGFLKEIDREANDLHPQIRVVKPNRELLFGFFPKGVQSPVPSEEELKQQIADISTAVEKIRSGNF
ncbi:MAG: hypothetical protein KKA07_11730 [Bacteroidetes bacterium]|nr:hypothetical protein [Bacteroidota bacterium]MBU1719729.1 hypothetical protein [Bacteroidota bacterium]